MAKARQEEGPLPIIPMTNTDLMGILLVGALMGLVLWGIGLLFNQYVFEVYFCEDAITSSCSNSQNYSATIASLIGGIAALVGLIRLRVYRPLLVLLASIISLWGILQTSWELDLFTGMLMVTALYALAFGVYSWVARVREFWIAIAAIIVIVVAVRLALVS